MPSSNVPPILAGVRARLARPAADIADAEELRPLLDATAARAVGCWRHENGILALAGFLAVDDMPQRIQTEFLAATRAVPLSATQYGIAQAVAAKGPAVNHRSEAATATAGSPGWLARLEAASSLAVPLFRQGDLAGALAIATSARIEPGDAAWNLMTELALNFGRAMRD
jgi:GAF domain-containing protein